MLFCAERLSPFCEERLVSEDPIMATPTMSTRLISIPPVHFKEEAKRDRGVAKPFFYYSSDSLVTIFRLEINGTTTYNITIFYDNSKVFPRAYEKGTCRERGLFQEILQGLQERNCQVTLSLC